MGLHRLVSFLLVTRWLGPPESVLLAHKCSHLIKLNNSTHIHALSITVLSVLCMYACLPSYLWACYIIQVGAFLSLAVCVRAHYFILHDLFGDLEPFSRLLLLSLVEIRSSDWRLHLIGEIASYTTRAKSIVCVSTTGQHGR